MSNKLDLREEVDFYNKKHGRETEGEVGYRHFLNAVYLNPGWLRRLPAYKEQQRKQELNQDRPKQTTSAQDDALRNEWLAAVNQKRKRDAESSTYGVPLTPLEIGAAPGMVSPESALVQAKVWFEERTKSAAAAREQEVQRTVREQQIEDARINKILHSPMPKNDPIWSKYARVVEHLTDESLDTLQQQSVEDLRRQIEAAKNVAALEVSDVMTGVVTPGEWAKAHDFITANFLNPTQPSSWGIAIGVLVEHKVIRKRQTPTVVVIPDPQLPVVEDRPVTETRPQGRAAQEAQRLADTLREIRAKLGEYLEEIESHDSVNPAEDVVVFNLYDSLLGKEITRDAVRKAYFYAALKIRGSRPSGFTDDEIEAWATDQTAMNQVSAAEYKRQMTLYGDVRLHRVPDPTNALLKELVQNTARKG